MDLPRRRVWREGAAVPLTPTEARLLEYLRTHVGRAVANDELLHHVWGYRKGLRSRTVPTTVRRLREKIEVDPSEPDHLLTVFAVGYRWEEAIGHAVSPGPVGRLFGRDRDLAVLERATGAPVTLVGTAGVGKTRLARAWAGPEAVFVDLAAATDADAVLRRVASHLQIRLGGRSEVDPIVFALRARGPTQVVLDNLEQAAGVAGPMVAAWAQATPDARWLVTSRVPLGTPGERIVGIEPLAHADAVALLVDRARLARPGGRFDDVSALGELVELLDRIPLALELGAARLAVMDPGDLVARLAVAPASIDPADGVGRGLRQSIATSFGLLSPAHRSALVQLAVFEDPFTLAAAESVVEVQGRVDDAVDTLVRHSLLRRIEGTPLRFAPFEAVRTFCADQVEAPVRDRHARWFAAGDSTPLRLGPPADDTEDLLAAFGWAERRGDTSLAVRLARVLDPALAWTGPTSTALAVMDRALRLPGPTEAERAALLAAQARSLRNTARQVEADPLAKEAEALVAGLGSDPAFRETRLLVGLVRAACALELGRPLEAIEVCDRLLPGAEEPWLVYSARGTRAGALFYLSRLDEAVAEYERLAASVADRYPEHHAAVLSLLGGAETDRGDLDRALSALERALAALESARLTLPFQLTITLGNLGHVCVELGRSERASEVLARALEAARSCQHPRYEGLVRLSRAALALDLGDPQAAELDLARAAELGRLDAHYEAIAHLLRGTAAQERGALPSAATQLEEAVSRAETVGHQRTACLARARLSTLHAGWGDLERAEELLASARGLPATDRALVAIEVHAGHLDLARGDVAGARARLAEATRPTPRGPAPHPAAWSTEVRWAARLLRQALG